MLECFLEDDEAMLSVDPDQFDPDIDWHCGERFARPPALPVRLLIQPGQGGVIPELSDVPLPVMSKRLAAAMKAAGVSNIEFFDAVIHDADSGADSITHVAYNIVGTAAAADLAATKFTQGSTSRLIDADIESLSIDPGKAGGALLFRLAESVNGIVVHRRVMDGIAAAGIHTLNFTPPEEWAG